MKKPCPQRLTIGLLGGSFNPAHDGHVAISRYALTVLGLDEIWWLVSPQNPLKSASGMADYRTRLAAAVKLATDPRIRVTDIEARLKTRYTVDTLRALRRRFPATRFVWLMGADNLAQIPKWRQWQDIFRLVPVAVFRRPGYAVGRGRGQAAIRFNRHNIPVGRAKLLPYARPPAWVILTNPLDRHSATAIRKAKAWQKD